MSNRRPAFAVAVYPLAQLACAFALGILGGTFLAHVFWWFVCCGALISAGLIAALLKDKLPLATALAFCATLLLGAAFANVEKPWSPLIKFDGCLNQEQSKSASRLN